MRGKRGQTENGVAGEPTRRVRPLCTRERTAAWGKPAEFTFLDFTNFCGKDQYGHFKVKRRTSGTNFGQSLRALSDWPRQARRKLRKSEMLLRAKTRVEGRLNSYAITENAQRCNSYLFSAADLVHKWLDRKSKRSAYNSAILILSH